MTIPSRRAAPGEITMPEIESRLLKVTQSCALLGLPVSEVEDMSDLTRHGEPGVALENLCVQLFEHDIALPDDLVETIRYLADVMDISEDYWRPLRPSSP